MPRFKNQGRHKPGSKDRHKPRHGDRHGPDYRRPVQHKDYHKRRRVNAEQVSMLFIDGEGCSFDSIGHDTLGMPVLDHRYVYLQAASTSRVEAHLTSKEGLHTETIFRWFMELKYGGMYRRHAFAGFALQYDVENWLRDLPDDAYTAFFTMQGGQDLATKPGRTWGYVVEKETPIGLWWRPHQTKWFLSWLPGKRFTVGRFFRDKKGFERHYGVDIYDTFGFFQNSFINALSKWDILLSPEVVQGKANRSTFSWPDYESHMVQDYAAAEGIAGAQLIGKFWKSIFVAYREAGLDLRPTTKQLYGPGGLANGFLRHYGMLEGWPVHLEDPEDMWCRNWRVLEAPEVTIRREAEAAGRLPSQGNRHPLKENLGTSMHFPFIWSFAGGRIESAAIGEAAHGYDFDANSAYPTAFTRLPRYADWGVPVWVEDTDAMAELVDRVACGARPLGMFQLRWDFPEGWDWYPFPYRERWSRLIFPARGEAFILSPEVYAVLDSLEDWRRYLRFDAFYGWPASSFGDGVRPLPPNVQSRVGAMMDQIMTVRLRLKVEHNPANEPLKLVANSSYGKAIQQVGRRMDKLGLFNPLVASWCTSFCRAMIWRAIASHKADHTVLAIQTDGVLSLVPLDVDLGPALGQWGQEEAWAVRQAMPGVYTFNDAEGRPVVKRRGFGGILSFDALIEWFKNQPGQSYPHRYITFVTRRMAMHYAEELGQFRYCWVARERGVGSDISVKRDAPETPIWPHSGLVWYPPYAQAPDYGHLMTLAYPYPVQFSSEWDEDYFLHFLAEREEESLESAGFFVFRE